MTIRVLIVDDSHFICKSIKRILEEEADFLVVGFAHNGQEAVMLAATLAPDVITMDVEMPVMDGIAAVKQIMANTPTPIIMFSAMTRVGSKATLEALSAGAIDFLPKQLEDIDGNLEQAKRCLRQRLRLVAATAPAVLRHSPPPCGSAAVAPATLRHFPRPCGSALIASAATVSCAVQRSLHPVGAVSKKPLDTAKTSENSLWQGIRLLVVVASTGGPLAMQTLLRQLPASCPIPVLLVQHMPTYFTRSFAERLNTLCQIRVKEAQHGDCLTAGLALVAPGGLQMEIRAVADQYRIALRAKTRADIYAPCADITLSSVAQHFAGHSLSVILTGMGSDGKKGAVKLKRQGALIWAQNEASCTIYGMPKAIIEAGLADKIFALDEMANAFTKISG